MSDSISIKRKSAIKSDNSPQNHIGLWGILLIAKKLDICTDTAKQNVDAYAPKLSKSASINIPQANPKRLIILLKVRTLMLPA